MKGVLAMSYSKEAMDSLLNRVAQKLDIDDELFGDANKEYISLGKWIESQTDYRVSIYPQGSFSLGTVIRPISDDDDYDLDLICELETGESISARQLKWDIVLPWLKKYRRIDGDIEEKRRCWHVEYSDIPNFHMDVVPAIVIDSNNNNGAIEITEHDEVCNTYEFIGSNPAGYTDWFYSRCEEQYNISNEKHLMELRKKEDVVIEPLDRRRAKMPLQSAIQLLKRHRDVMFDSYPDEDAFDGICKSDKPISILITTLVAQLYDNGDSIIDTINGFLTQAEGYIKGHMKNGEYCIENPSYPGDNLLNKWNEDLNRRDAFFEWLTRAKNDFSYERLSELNKDDMLRFIISVFGERLGTRVASEMAKEDRESIKNGTLRVNAKTGSLSNDGEIVVPSNHHHHA